MFKMTAAALSLAAFAVFAEESKAPADAKPLATDPLKKENKMSIEEATKLLSYANGFMIGQQAKSQGLPVNLEAFAEGLKVATEGGKMPYEQEQLEAAYAILQNAAKAKADAAKAAVAGELKEFLAKKDLKSTDSGLKYQVITEGKGDSPKATSQVKVHYTGWLTDGTKFDSSVDRGEPATFGLNQVIAGWTEGVQLMKPGSKFRFFIPWKLAYGEQGGGPIPGKSDLIFDVELLEIVK
ncbi:MAG: hypothetical protein RL095_102 [Verrucomicrobiota bacterium]|jgi:FKBP-type peptidyl-prolyl cis-trans isomerase